ncbi:MAG: DUF2752 domain-containing protein [Verrucomicrobiota bacterium]|jgi:hypothetical protein
MRAESQSAPPKIAASQSLAFFTVVVLVVAALGSGAVLFFFDPAKHGFFPVCLFHSLTGLNCPGCGATRAAYQLLHGHLVRALHDNALFVLTLTALTVQGAWLVMRKIRKREVGFVMSPVMLWALLVTVFVFTVLRNLPAFAWLSP